MAEAEDDERWEVEVGSAGGRAGSGGEEGLARGGDGGGRAMVERVCSEVTPTVWQQQGELMREADGAWERGPKCGDA